MYGFARDHSKKQRGSVTVGLVLMLGSAVGCFSVAGSHYNQSLLDAQLLSAVRHNDLPAVKTALKNSASPNAAEYDQQSIQTIISKLAIGTMFKSGPPKATAVGLAAAWIGSYQNDISRFKSNDGKDVRDNRAIMSLLLNAHADPNRQDIDCNTPIIIAVGDGNREAARLLIQHHARLDLKGNYQRVSLARWMTEPGWEYPSPKQIMRCELLRILEQERKAEAIRRNPLFRQRPNKWYSELLNSDN